MARLPPEGLRALSDWLWSEEGAQVFAVVDGASIPGLLEKLYAERAPQSLCLYRGELEPDMATVAPYLVCLQPDAEFTEWLLAAGWGNHWGVFFRSSASLLELRKHLRNINMVYGPDLEPLLFRYYDPRVMRAFMSVCEPAQVTDLFGPIASWIAESEDGSAALAYAPTGASVSTSERAFVRARA